MELENLRLTNELKNACSMLMVYQQLQLMANNYIPANQLDFILTLQSEIERLEIKKQRLEKIKI
ncbi:24508_t:CDS:2, partial [Gigaspora margarita]